MSDRLRREEVSLKLQLEVNNLKFELQEQHNREVIWFIGRRVSEWVC